MGTPDIAARVLEDLADYEEIVAVFTQPDSIAKRGKKLLASPVKQKAIELGLDVFCPESMRDEDSINTLRSLSPDVVIVAAYGQILCREVLDIPHMGCLNIHVSLLPKWRGAAPIERAILAGNEKIGMCLMRMEEGLDTGDFCYSKEIEAYGKTLGDVVDEMLDGIGKQLHIVLDTLQYAPDDVEWIEQDDSSATYAEKLGKRELYISVNDDAKTLWRKVLASSPSRTSKIEICGKPVSLLSVKPTDVEIEGVAGEVFYAGKKLYLIAADGNAVEVLEVKPDGKNAMSAKAFCAGISALHKAKGSWNAIG